MINGPAAVAAIEAAGFTHLVWLPDSNLGTWESALAGSRLGPARACREGEAVAIAAGLVLAAHRGDRVVITTMGSVAIWPTLSDSPRDFHYLPSSMGQGVPLGLGLCLAKPGLGVVVLTGDGGLLMNLGCLVTAAQHRVPLYVLLIDNGPYEVTGGQPVAGAGRTDFDAVALGAGFERVYGFETRDGWQAQAAECPGGGDPTEVGNLGNLDSVRTTPLRLSRYFLRFCHRMPSACRPPSTS